MIVTQESQACRRGKLAPLVKIKLLGGSVPFISHMLGWLTMHLLKEKGGKAGYYQ